MEIINLVIRAIFSIAIVAFCMYFLILPLFHAFLPMIYLVLPFDAYVIIYHILAAFTFMLGLWALSKILA